MDQTSTEHPTSPTTITVIDAIMGSGKTSYAFDMMNRAWASAIFSDDPDTATPRFLYVTPFLKEIERLKGACDVLDFRSPVDGSIPKGAQLEALFREGHNVATTHALLPYIPEAALKSAREQGYQLVLDEALEAFTLVDTVKHNELEWAIKAGMIRVDADTGHIVWTLGETGLPASGHRYDDLKREALTGGLRIFGKGKGALIREMNPEIVRAFGTVTILTYLFEGSTMATWLKIHGLSWKTMTLTRGAAEPVAWTPEADQEAKAAVAGRLKLHTGSANQIGDYRRKRKGVRERGRQKFTKTYLDKAPDDECRQIAGVVTRYIEREVKCPGDRVGWTTFQTSHDQMKGQTSQDHLKDQTSKDHLKGRTVQNRLKGPRYRSGTCFIPLNARASNDWSDREVMIYLVNRYMNPVLKQYIAGRGQEVDEDLWALSELLQWLWRGCIRQEDGPDMHVLVPAERMRSLLLDWLETSSKADPVMCLAA